MKTNEKKPVFMCECKEQPNPDRCSLEGFELGEVYKAELIPAKPMGRQEHYRVWPDVVFCPEYYETCPVVLFKKYFRRLKETTCEPIDYINKFS